MPEDITYSYEFDPAEVLMTLEDQEGQGKAIRAQSQRPGSKRKKRV